MGLAFSPPFFNSVLRSGLLCLGGGGDEGDDVVAMDSMYMFLFMSNACVHITVVVLLFDIQ